MRRRAREAGKTKAPRIEPETAMLQRLVLEIGDAVAASDKDELDLPQHLVDSRRVEVATEHL